jgi:hypothetical protein
MLLSIFLKRISKMKSKSSILFAVIFFLIFGCVTKPQTQVASENATTWLGASLDDAIMTFGPPISTYKLSNGNIVSMWKSTRSYQEGGQGFIVPNMSFGSTGNYLGSTWGVAHNPATTQYENCKLIFVTNTNNIIIGGRTEGGFDIPKYSGMKHSIQQSKNIPIQPTSDADNINESTQTASIADIQKQMSLLETIKGKWQFNFNAKGACWDWNATAEIRSRDGKGTIRSKGWSNEFTVSPDGGIHLKNNPGYQGYLTIGGYGHGIYRYKLSYGRGICKGTWEARKIESY